MPIAALVTDWFAVAPESDRGAVILALGIIALTVAAGLVEVAQCLRRSAAWPVPLVIYGTLLPIVLFVLVMAGAAGEGLGPGYLVMVAAPAPLIALLRIRAARSRSMGPGPDDRDPPQPST